MVFYIKSISLNTTLNGQFRDSRENWDSQEKPAILGMQVETLSNIRISVWVGFKLIEKDELN